MLSNRLTIGFTANQNNEDNVNTVSAVRPGGLVSEGVTQPNLSRRFGGNAQLQVSDRQALHFSTNYNTNSRSLQGIGGITLRERGRNSEFGFASFNVRSLTQLSDRTLLDVTTGYNRHRNENRRITQGVAIDVKDAFEGGGTTSQNEADNRTVSVQSLLMRTGDRLTFKAGFDLEHMRDRSLTEDDFNGTFEFASLEDFRAGTPTTYTVATGDPLLEMTQVEGAAFVQNDFRVSPRLTLMFGLRYEAQSNLDDWNNVDPRFGYAYALSDSTVLRGGVGLFHDRLHSNNVKRLLRLDGTRQQELVVTNPSYPNPFLSGTASVIPPSSIRVRSPDLEAVSDLDSQVSIEQTLPGNVQATVSYEYTRSNNRYRSVNLNAPRPGEIEPQPTGRTGTGRRGGRGRRGSDQLNQLRPDPTQGNILELRSTGRSVANSLRFDVRQRLRILTISANYNISRQMEDSEGAFSLPSNNHDLSADWGRAGDRTHWFGANVNAQLPLGIFLTLGVQAGSGQPWTITTGRDDNGDTVSNDRPLGVSRNSEIGPGFRSTDINLSKVFFLRGAGGGPRTGGAGAQINVFANISNVLNRANLQRVSGALTSTRFGQPTSAGDPREIEIGMRFQF